MNLLPCPFCGGPVELEETRPTYDDLYGRRRWWGVKCRNTENLGGTCAIEANPTASKEAAVARWNMRAPIGPKAPWPDYLGQPIHHGDRLIHPTGQCFTAIRLHGYEHESDAWRAVYDDASPPSRLVLQIGDKGQAVLERTAEP